MPGYISFAVKATSTVCALCSAFMLARSHYKRTHSTSSQSSSSTSTNEEPPLKRVFSDFDNTFFPDTMEQDEKSNLWKASRLFLHRSWSTVSRLCLGLSANDSNFAVTASSKKYANMTVEMFRDLLRTITDLTEKAEISTAVPTILSNRGTTQLRRTNSVSLSIFEDFLESLVACTKNDKFVDLLVVNNNLQNLLDFILSRIMTTMSTNSSASSSTILDVPAEYVSVWSPDTQSLDQTAESTSSPSDTEENTSDVQSSTFLSDREHPTFRLHILFAFILSNMSRCPRSCPLFDNADIEFLLNLWSTSPSLQLALLSEKIRHNAKLLASHFKSSDRPTDNPISEFQFDETSQRSLPKPIYYPDIYRLDSDKSIAGGEAETYDFDIIFVHGMRGSICHTWRQNDAVLKDTEAAPNEYTTCWPRDWLSSHFPNARIIGIDTCFKPFIWNPLFHIDKLQRTLDLRAHSLLPQLEAAGIGQRPIIWVTHSLGGVLVKEILRMSKHSNPSFIEDGLNDILTRPYSTGALFDKRIFEESDNLAEKCEDLSTKFDCVSDPEDTVDNSVVSFADTDSVTDSTISKPISSGPTQTSTCSHDPFALTNQTKGIIFMSVPHRGNVSLLMLYRWPLRWILTPEAMQLERNNDYLLKLHSWFSLWSFRSHVAILTMVETLPTRVNWFWSVLLVPEDSRDRELGEIFPVDYDHTYLSKPKSCTDPSYVKIVDFIECTMNRLAVE